MGKSKRIRNRKSKKGQRRAIIHPRTAHIKAATMPNSFTIRLKWSDDVTTTALSSWRFGLAQFWNQIPGYYSQYMTIYKMSRILSVRANVTAINTTANTPAELVMVVLPYSDYSRTLAEAKKLPKSKYKYLSGSGGLDRVSLTYTANLNSTLGVDSRSIRDYQQSASEAASTLALLPDTPVLAVYVGGASTEPTLRVFTDIYYDIEFFEPEQPGSTALGTGKLPIDLTQYAVRNAASHLPKLITDEVRNPGEQNGNCRNEFESRDFHEFEMEDAREALSLRVEAERQLRRKATDRDGTEENSVFEEMDEKPITKIRRRVDNPAHAEVQKPRK